MLFLQSTYFYNPRCRIRLSDRQTARASCAGTWHTWHITSTTRGSMDVNGTTAGAVGARGGYVAAHAV